MLDDSPATGDESDGPMESSTEQDIKNDNEVTSSAPRKVDSASDKRPITKAERNNGAPQIVSVTPDVTEDEDLEVENDDTVTASTTRRRRRRRSSAL